jgi:DNA-binding transcriptional ArsR family regulator
MEIDRKTLKALAADTRLDILKSLGKRRKTPSELSKELGLAPSTVIEHLNRLEEANLIRREETGHKWIYYALTKKGTNLVKPKVPTQFIIVFGICVFIIFAGFLFYYINYPNYIGGTFSSSTSTQTRDQATESTKMPEEIGESEIPPIPTLPIEGPSETTGITEGNATNFTNTTNSTNQTT